MAVKDRSVLTDNRYRLRLQQLTVLVPVLVFSYVHFSDIVNTKISTSHYFCLGILFLSILLIWYFYLTAIDFLKLAVHKIIPTSSQKTFLFVYISIFALTMIMMFVFSEPISSGHRTITFFVFISLVLAFFEYHKNRVPFLDSNIPATAIVVSSSKHVNNILENENIFDLKFEQHPSSIFDDKITIETLQRQLNKNVDALNKVLSWWGDNGNRNRGNYSFFWHVILKHYINGEYYELEKNEIVTSVDLYVHILISLIRLNKSLFEQNGGACFLGYTNFIPSYQIAEALLPVPKQEFLIAQKSQINAFNQKFSAIIKEADKHNQQFTMKRVIAMNSTQPTKDAKNSHDEIAKRGFYSYKKFLNVARKNLQPYRQYINNLHFAPEQACYFLLDRYCSWDSGLAKQLAKFRDLVVFGHGDDINSAEWLFAVSSDVLPGHRAMIMKFHNFKNGSVQVFEGDKIKVNLKQFIQNICRDSRPLPDL